ncbi:MAG: lysine--tRNA ligase [Proteobacteria bacterium]|nr:lysine--tRNA ligase [Pseudomonadota bacterium]
MEEINELIAQRRQKLEDLIEEGINPYPNNFTPDALSGEISEKYESLDGETLREIEDVFTLAGRIMTKRVMGKAAFVHIQDRKGKIQLYLKRDSVGEESYRQFKKFDIGDFVGIRGRVFKTKTGELSIDVSHVELVVKTLRPLPEKWHGLTDIETRYRQRYVDLIVNPGVKEIFIKRGRLIQHIRNYLMERDYLEVETPMMQPIPGGATAKPFMTYHHALDMDLYLRIAPELYLKRLVVGGVERVFEINRNFRNEGISPQHNPEFTMLEFYQAYATYEDLIDLIEDMLSSAAKELTGSHKVVYEGQEIDLTAPWDRLTVNEAILKYSDADESILTDRTKAFDYAKKVGLEPEERWGLGKILTEIFDEVAEAKLIQPTFITEYPTEVSPLSRKNDDNPDIVDRFELFICGREMANAFSELNDPIDQRERFEAQVAEKDAGDEEAHFMDADYIRALEYGMPPTAGAGLGIDRIVMLLTGSSSIRDVLFFPHMRPEEGRKSAAKELKEK